MNGLDRRTAFGLAAVLGGGGMLLARSAVAQQPATRTELDEIRERGVLRVGAAITTPYYTRPPGGDWSGIVPDIMRIVGDYLRVRVEFVETQWGTAVAGLQTNRFDVMGAFNATPERALAVDFTRRLTEIGFGLLTLDTASQDFETWAQVDQAGLRLVAQDGASSTRSMERRLTRLTWVRVPTFDALLLELESRRSQAALVDAIAGSLYVASRNRGRFVTPTPVYASDTNLAVRKGATTLRDWLDVTIRFMEQQGQIEQVWGRYVAVAR